MRHRKKYNQRGNLENLQKILLCFLVGFFVGAVLYYLFQKSFSQMETVWKQNTALGEKETPFLSAFLHTLWEHGKYYILFLIMSAGRWKRAYPIVFVIYTGLRNGFFMMFLFFVYGVKGLLLTLLSSFPQALLFVPLYLFSFSYVNEKRQSKHRVGMGLAILFVFTAACLLEVKINLPLMQMFL